LSHAQEVGKHCHGQSQLTRCCVCTYTHAHCNAYQGSSIMPPHRPRPCLGVQGIATMTALLHTAQRRANTNNPHTAHPHGIHTPCTYPLTMMVPCPTPRTCQHVNLHQHLRPPPTISDVANLPVSQVLPAGGAGRRAPAHKQCSSNYLLHLLQTAGLTCSALLPGLQIFTQGAHQPAGTWTLHTPLLAALGLVADTSWCLGRAQSATASGAVNGCTYAVCTTKQHMPGPGHTHHIRSRFEVA
jgi:hypothetical protein